MRRLFALLALLPVGADWPQHLGPTRDGHSPETGLLKEWPGDGPPKLWEAAVGSGFSGPVVAAGKVVLFHRIGDNEVLQCWAAGDGKELWKAGFPTGYVDDFGFDDGPRATPSITDGRVYAVGAEGHLVCVKLDDGSKVWERDLARDYPFKKGFFGVGPSPLVDDKRVYLNVGGEGAGVVALDRDTGKELWKATDDAASYSSPVLADVGGKRAVVFLTRAGLLVLDPATGAVRHQTPYRARLHASVNAATPLVADGHLFLSSSYNVGATLFKTDGWSRVWANDESLTNHYNTSVKVGDFLYGLHGRQESGADLRCVEWATGKVRWSQEHYGCATLIAADGRLIAVCENGDVVQFAATPEGYKSLGRFTGLEKVVRAAPALSDGRLFARDSKRLVVWNLK